MLCKLFFLLVSSSAVLAQTHGCPSGFTAGTDSVIYTAAYTYTEVMSIIGSFKNLTWSGSPDNTVTLNGTDNTVGTARTYDIAGAHVIETITVYEKPANGPYVEIHTLNTITIPAAGNLMVSADFDGTTVTETCGGKASIFNLTINFCSTNATLAAGVLHMIHLTDVETVTKFLGGKNFTSCEALGDAASSSAMSSATATSSVMPIVTAAAVRAEVGFGLLAVLAALAGVAL